MTHPSASIQQHTPGTSTSNHKASNMYHICPYGTQCIRQLQAPGVPAHHQTGVRWPLHRQDASDHPTHQHRQPQTCPNCPCASCCQQLLPGCCLWLSAQGQAPTSPVIACCWVLLPLQQLAAQLNQKHPAALIQACWAASMCCSVAAAAAAAGGQQPATQMATYDVPASLVSQPSLVACQQVMGS